MSNEEKHEFKSKAKAIGLKSAFIVDDNNIYMTSFGKENEAIPEKNIVDKTVIDLATNFEAKALSHSNVTVSNDKYSAEIFVQNPQKQNQLRAKDTIEKKFFGTTFSDNIHIQLAYNIMDINKILGYYISHVVAAINDMRRLGNKENDDDFVGTFFTDKTFESDRLAYIFNQLDLIDWEHSNGQKRLQFKQDSFDFLFDVYDGVGSVKNDARFEIAKKLSDKINEYKIDSSLEAMMKNEFDMFRAKLLELVNEKTCWQKATNNIKKEKIYDYKYFIRGAEDYVTCKKIVKSSLYFSDAFSFKCADSGKKTDDSSENLNSFYNVLRLISNVRHGLTHSKNSVYGDFAIDDNGVLNGLFNKRIEKINSEFMTTNKVNLQILFEVLPGSSKVDIAKSYYDFVVRKNYENLGFSVRTLREAMLELDAKDASDNYLIIRNKHYDSVRNKINSIWDFLIYRYFIENEKDALHFQKQLRNLLDKSKKEKLYNDRAAQLWPVMKKQIRECVLPKLEPDSLKAYKNYNVDAVAEKAVSSSFTTAENMSTFSKAIYVLTLFLDAKEINMFLTTLINKFDNIESLKKVLSSDELKKIKSQTFVPELMLRKEYSLFSDSGAVRDELIVVKSLAKMNKSVQAHKKRITSVKLPHYLDAAALFGLSDEDAVDKAFHLSDGPNATTEQKALRNFFTTNVINSKRFNYIIRFLNPQKAPRIMQNPALVGYVLNSLPDSQLLRYCRDTDIPFDENKPDFEKMKNDLVKLLVSVTFDSFRSVKQQAQEGSADEQIKQHYVAVIGLYQTVLYLLVKSLVRVNATYAIAMNALEFDFGVMNEKYGSEEFAWEIIVPSPENPSKKIKKANGDCITRKFLSDPDLPMNANVKRSITENENLYTNILFRQYRDVIVHQNAVNALADFSDRFNKVTDIFDLFHCLVFMTIVDKMEKNPNTTEKTRKTIVAVQQAKCRNGKTVYENILENNTAVRDLVYAINTPFAYNPARYMNLSCKKIFLESYGK